jgi:hypothetical protein
MINADIREYEYYTFGVPFVLGSNGLNKAVMGDGYGQPVLSKDVRGTIKMAIYTTAQAIQNNIAYNNASYVGLTHDSKVNDAYVIKYGEKRLKVMYVQQRGRYKQVFLGDM